MTAIATYIEQIADDMSLGFFHGPDDKFNQEADDLSFPVMLLDIYKRRLPEITEQGTVHSPYELIIYFLKEYDQGDTESTYNGYIDEMRVKSDIFMTKCVQKETATGVKVFQVVEPQEEVEVLAKTDRNLCGVRLTIRLTLSEKYINC